MSVFLKSAAAFLPQGKRRTCELQGGWVGKKKAAPPLCGPRLGGGSKTRRASDAGSLLLGVLRYFLRPGQARLRARRASARWRPRSLESSRRRGSNRPADAEPGFIRQGVHRWRRSSSVRHGRRASARLSNRGRAGWSFAARACRLSRPRVQSPGGVGFGLRAGAYSSIALPTQAPAQMFASERSSRVLRMSLAAGLTD